MPELRCSGCLVYMNVSRLSKRHREQFEGALAPLASLVCVWPESLYLRDPSTSTPIAKLLQVPFGKFYPQVGFRAPKLSHRRRPLMEVQKLLGARQMVMESLCGWPVQAFNVVRTQHHARLNLQLLMESDAFICTWTSNWYGPDPFFPPRICGSRAVRCRLVDEMRMTAPALAPLCLVVCPPYRCAACDVPFPFRRACGGGAQSKPPLIGGEQARSLESSRHRRLHNARSRRCPRFNWVHGGGAETPDYR